jgi:hypothetical protein
MKFFIKTGNMNAHTLAKPFSLAIFLVPIPMKYWKIQLYSVGNGIIGVLSFYSEKLRLRC